MRVMLVEPAGVTELASAPHQAPSAGWIWFDCDYEEARAWVDPVGRLTGVMVFDDHLLNAQNLQHPSQFDATPGYEMVVFRGLANTNGSGAGVRGLRIETRPTVFFLFVGCLVTVRAPDSRTVTALRRRLLEATGSRQRPPESPAALMLRLLNGMVDRYLELRQPLTEQLERWQRMLLDPGRPFADWYALLEARDELRRLEQLCEEQLDAIQEWRDERLEQTRAGADHGHQAPGYVVHADPLRMRASDLIEHVQRVLSHVRRLEASIESAVQMHFSATAHRTNEIMRVLTALTAVFMPLTLITGIFGMNFEVLPGTHAASGFWWTMAAMAAIAIGLLGWFRARRFLNSPERQLRRRRRVSASASQNEPRA